MAESFDYTELEDVIVDVEGMALTLLGLATSETAIEHRAIHWIGCQLADAGSRLRGQIDAYLADAMASSGANR